MQVKQSLFGCPPTRFRPTRFVPTRFFCPTRFSSQLVSFLPNSFLFAQLVSRLKITIFQFKSYDTIYHSTPLDKLSTNMLFISVTRKNIGLILPVLMCYLSCLFR